MNKQTFLLIVIATFFLSAFTISHFRANDPEVVLMESDSNRNYYRLELDASGYVTEILLIDNLTGDTVADLTSDTLLQGIVERQ